MTSKRLQNSTSSSVSGFSKMVDTVDKGKKRKKNSDGSSRPSKKVTIEGDRKVKISVQNGDQWAPIIGMADRTARGIARNPTNFQQHLRLVLHSPDQFLSKPIQSLEEMPQKRPAVPSQPRNSSSTQTHTPHSITLPGKKRWQAQMHCGSIMWESTIQKQGSWRFWRRGRWWLEGL